MRARQLSYIFNMINNQCRHGTCSVAQGIVLAMTRAGLHFDEITSLAPGIALPLHDALEASRPSPPTGWPVEAYELVGRADLAFQEVTARRILDESSRHKSALQAHWPAINSMNSVNSIRQRLSTSFRSADLVSADPKNPLDEDGHRPSVHHARSFDSRMLSFA